MLKEIFNNGIIQLLYDAETDTLSPGWYSGRLTEWEVLIFNKLFEGVKVD